MLSFLNYLKRCLLKCWFDVGSKNYIDKYDIEIYYPIYKSTIILCWELAKVRKITDFLNVKFALISLKHISNASESF